MSPSSSSFACIEKAFQNRDVKVLSLDCFDTLYWRNVSRPFDIFTRLGHGLCPTARSRAEASARNKKKLTSGIDEVTLADIYAELSDQFDPEQQRQMIEHELSLEKENGFLFPPALALLRQAKARGIRTIVVSDTYLTAAELGRLLATHCEEIPHLIDHIYCSSESGHGKTATLWPVILQREQVNPQDIFHVGDNLHADYLKPAGFGITAHHFLQNAPLIKQTLEQNAVAAKMLFPLYGATAPVPSLFHACYSIALRDQISSEQLTGWTVLGPVLYAFARFIRQQRDRQPATRLGFLMRDGYMLREAYHALYPDAQSAALHISRLTAIRSSFTCRQRIDDYLVKTLKATEKVSQAGFAMIARHLMLSEPRRKKIASLLKKHHYASDQLFKLLLTREVVQETLARSAACRLRLIAHLQSHLQLQAGDTLMLVDLGYTGTAQNLLGPLLEEALEIKVRGCYVIAAWTPGWQQNRAGLINPDIADYRFIRTLTNYIAAFEMLCSSHTVSVVDYREDGEPIGEGQRLPENRLLSIQALQREAIACVRLADELAVPCSAALWELAAISIVRYIYLPLAEETAILERLTFDINMGTGSTRKLVDLPEAISYLRQYGIARLTHDESGTSRTNTPAELRSCGIEYSLSLLAASRYALSWSLSQGMQRQQALEVVFVNQEQPAVVETLSATSTFDGFFSLYIPLVTPEIAVLTGKTLRDFELFRVGLIPQQALHQKYEQQSFQPLEKDKDFFIDGATQVNNLVVDMQDEGFIYLRPAEPQMKSLIQLIYRPIHEKSH